MPKKYGYARCSTPERERKQDISRQRRELKAMGAEDIICEHEPGANAKRPKLGALLAELQEGDTLYCTEVSRITRSVAQLCAIIDVAREKKIMLCIGTEFVMNFCSENINPMTKAMLQLMTVFAELERDMIIVRIRSGIANAKEKGVKFGRPKKTAADVPKQVRSMWELYKQGIHTKVSWAKACRISRPTLDRYIRLLEETEMRDCAS